MTSPFKDLVRQLFARTAKTDEALQPLQSIAQAIRQRQNPRSQFNRWRQSRAGQDWRAAQYQKQQGHCAICAVAIPFKWSHIDPIQPLKTHPELAIAPTNLRITCPECHWAKGGE